MAYTNVEQPKKNKMFNWMANPVIRKMAKKGDFSSENACTYGGIAAKTGYFLIVSVIGVFLCLILHNIFLGSTPEANYLHFADTDSHIIDLTLAPIEGVILGIVVLVDIITPFLAFFVRPTIPVVGTIYSVAQGMLIGYLTIALVSEYKFLSLLAAIITLCLVAVMLFVYAKRIIKVTARFRGIVVTVFFGIIISGAVYFLLNLIPAVRNSGLFSGINTFMGNPAVSVVMSVIFIILACLFMLADFDTIERCVENRMDKKYEWMAAWGLAYTVLYIYFKILQLLLTIFGNSKNSSN